MNISISCAEYPDLSVDELLTKAKSFGVEFVEFSMSENLRRGTNGELPALLSKHDLKVSAIICDSLKNIGEGISLCESTGAKYLILHDDGIETVQTKKSALRSFRESMLQNVALAEKSGVTLAIENLPLGISRSPQDLLELIEAVDSPCFKMMFDANNFYNAGVEGFPYAYELLKRHIVYIHVKDSKQYDKALFDDNYRVLHRAAKNVICVVAGQGALNWEGILSALKADNYNGFLTIEPHVAPEQMDKMFVDTISYLRAHGV